MALRRKALFLLTCTFTFISPSRRPLRPPRPPRAQLTANQTCSPMLTGEPSWPPTTRSSSRLEVGESFLSINIYLTINRPKMAALAYVAQRINRRLTPDATRERHVPQRAGKPSPTLSVFTSSDVFIFSPNSLHLASQFLLVAPVVGCYCWLTS